MDFIASPSTRLLGEIRVPGDKSISHRAVLLGALSEGITTIEGFLPSKDCLATVLAMRQLGVKIDSVMGDTMTIYGMGLKGLKPPSHEIDCGNSGTLMRLIAGVLSAQPFSSTLIGDLSLSYRPMERVILPLTRMGANIMGNISEENIYPPLQIQGNPFLKGIEYVLPVASAQVKSCLLFAGLCANSEIKIIDSSGSRDHTERLLSAFGADISIDHHHITLKPSVLSPQFIQVPGDISSAAFFIAGASMRSGSHVFIRDVGINPTRYGIISILQAMGAKIHVHSSREMGKESVADIEIVGSFLRGIDIKPEWVVSAIDEFPVLFIVAACAEGQTVLKNAKELRNKETDRIMTMARGLHQLGIDLEILPDGIIIQGGELQGGEVDSAGDHRVAMAFAMASLIAKAPILIRNCVNVATSFPNFVTLSQQLGLNIHLVN